MKDKEWPDNIILTQDAIKRGLKAIAGFITDKYGDLSIDYCTEAFNGLHITNPVSMREIIGDAIKTIDDQQQKKGHWIEKVDFDSNPYYECSVCGVLWTMIDGTPEDNGMKYCPRCGARLEGCTHDEL